MLTTTPPSAAEMYSGVFVDLLNPTPASIRIDDIAAGLSKTCRYGGQILAEHYSVAEHTVLVHDLLTTQGAPVDLKIAALFHDAHEAYVHDVTSPAKHALRQASDMFAYGTAVSPYDTLTDRFDAAICERLGIDRGLLADPRLKTADMWALRIEAAELTRSGGRDWRWPATLPHDGQLPHGVTFHGGLPASVAAAGWLARVHAAAPWSLHLEHALDEMRHRA